MLQVVAPIINIIVVFNKGAHTLGTALNCFKRKDELVPRRSLSSDVTFIAHLTMTELM